MEWFCYPLFSNCTQKNLFYLVSSVEWIAVSKIFVQYFSLYFEMWLIVSLVILFVNFDLIHYVEKLINVWSLSNFWSLIILT